MRRQAVSDIPLAYKPDEWPILLRSKLMTLATQSSLQIWIHLNTVEYSCSLSGSKQCVWKGLHCLRLLSIVNRSDSKIIRRLFWENSSGKTLPIRMMNSQRIHTEFQRREEKSGRSPLECKKFVWIAWSNSALSNEHLRISLNFVDYLSHYSCLELQSY